MLSCFCLAGVKEVRENETEILRITEEILSEANP